MTISPSFAGFADAQARLREQFGHDLTFYTAGVPTWPPGVALDPETGTPYDPTIDPVDTGEAQAIVRVSVVSRPLGLSRTGVSDSSERKAIGWVEEGGVVLIVDPDDWDQVENATEFTYADERYAVRQTDHDYLGPVERYLIYGSQK